MEAADDQAGQDNVPAAVFRRYPVEYCFFIGAYLPFGSGL